MSPPAPPGHRFWQTLTFSVTLTWFSKVPTSVRLPTNRCSQWQQDCTYLDRLKLTKAKIKPPLRRYGQCLNCEKKNWRNAGSEAPKAPRYAEGVRIEVADYRVWGSVVSSPRQKTNLVTFVAARMTLIATICLISVSLNTAVVHSHYCGTPRRNRSASSVSRSSGMAFRLSKKCRYDVPVRSGSV